MGARRVRWALAMVMLSLGIFFGLMGGTAGAQVGNCSGQGCFDQYRWAGGGGPYGLGVFTGGGAVLRVPSTSSVTKYWVDYNIVADLRFVSSGSVNPGGFVEVGAIQGYLCCGGGGSSSSIRWFWGDKRPNSAYYAHFVNWASPGDSAYVQIEYAGSNSVSIYGGGFLLGTSSVMPCCAAGLEVGSATYNSSGTGAVGSMSATNATGLTYRSLGGTWNAGWTTSYAGTLFTDVYNPPYSVGVVYPAGNWIYGY